VDLSAPSSADWPKNFRIPIEPFRVYHPPEHAIGCQDPNLALDLQHRRVVSLIRGRKIVADGVEIRRVDENLRYRGIPVRYGDYEQQRYGERGNCGQKDRRLTSPEDRQDTLKINAARGGKIDAHVGRADGLPIGLGAGPETFLVDSLDRGQRKLRALVMAPKRPGIGASVPDIKLKAHAAGRV